MSGAVGETLVLVADDDADVRELVVFRLERAGYEVIAAADGEQALGLALERRPAVCVIDVQMPGLDGYELTERLRASPEAGDAVHRAAHRERAAGGDRTRASAPAPTTT